MKTNLVVLVAPALLLATSALATANGQDIDVQAVEVIDVIETADGSIWKGVLIEQTPNVSYKIAIAGGSVHVIKAPDVVKLTRERNRDRPRAVAATIGQPTGGVMGRYDRPSSLPAPHAKTGIRVEPELIFVFPQGVLSDLKLPTSFAPGVRVGYEHMFGNFGLGGGGQARFTSWQLPGETMDALWTLETMLYVRAAAHIGRVVPYAGLSFGLDTNYVYLHGGMESNTSVGFGMNLSTGVSVVVSPTLSLDIGLDYHPVTDTINDLAPETASISYVGMRVGLGVRL